MTDILPKVHLCICQWGHSRSVAMTRILHGNGFQAVACGYAGSITALEFLSERADVILIAASYMSSFVPEQHRHKVVDLDIGEDRWSNPYNHDLLDLCKGRIQQKLGYQLKS